MSGITADNAGRSSGLVKASVSGILWQSVVTASTLTAVAGRGYPINTTSNVCTVTLPTSAEVGDTIKFVDYARNWGTNAVTLTSSLNFQGVSSVDPVYDTDLQSVTITYVDVTQGWIPTVDDAVTYETPVAYTAEWLIIAGGAGGGSGSSTGGGGAGGYRNAYASETSGRGGSTETVASLTNGVVYTIDVGAGGAATIDGENSSISGSGFSTLTSTGGGGGGGRGADVALHTGNNGGCGGGGGTTSGDGTTCPGGSGTTNQGYDGGFGRHISGAWEGGGGGGGTGVAGGDVSSGTAGSGGNGLASAITASTVTRGGGGGARGGSSSAGGSGGGGAGNNSGTGVAGTANTGGGGGAGNSTGGAGGSGVIILRIPDANYSGTTSGSPTIDTSSVADETILIFNGDGTYTA